jgi:serine/threonine protein kinase
VGRALAEALTRVHAAGVVHRDVKPANILLEPADSGWPVVRLADFGIARLDDAPPLTAEGMTIGTANYLSPEQVRGEGAGPASDVYSLGLVLIECLSGRVEYAGPGVEAALARLSRDPAVPSSAPEPLRGLLVAMTARDPAVRPTAAAVAAQLAAAASAADQEQGTTVLPAVAQPAPARESVAGTAVLPARPARSRRAAVLAVVVAAVVMAAVIAAVITAVAAGSGPLPSGPPHYPSVPGRLGTHLVQLERAVG